jgi:hypothetical protein
MRIKYMFENIKTRQRDQSFHYDHLYAKSYIYVCMCACVRNTAFVSIKRLPSHVTLKCLLRPNIILLLFNIRSQTIFIASSCKFVTLLFHVLQHIRTKHAMQETPSTQA